MRYIVALKQDNMLSVLALAAIETLFNRILATDDIAKHELGELSGKTLRLIMHTPAIKVDTLFCDTGIRFEPVSESIFEPQGGIAAAVPDCVLTVDNVSHLLSLIKNPQGNLPIRGDHRVLMRVQAVMDNFEPDIWLQIDRLIGTQASSHLHLISQELAPVLSPIGQLIKDFANSAINQATQNSKMHQTLDDELLAKKQQLLALQSDIEREQAKLLALTQQTQTTSQ